MPIDSSAQERLQKMLAQAMERWTYITALALVSPGGQLWAAVLPEGVEAESVAAMAAPAALLGRRIALEQLEGDMRQVYVEGERGYVILRAVGREAILLAVAAADANLALVLHDVLQIERHAAEVIGAVPGEARAWVEAGPAIERLRRLTREALLAPPEERMADLKDKLASLNIGYFPERVADIRERIERSWAQGDFGAIEAIETDLLALERDVVALAEQSVPLAVPVTPGGPPAMAVAAGSEPVAAGERSPSLPGRRKRAGKEPMDTRGSWIRRALRWLASMIASED